MDRIREATYTEQEHLTESNISGTQDDTCSMGSHVAAVAILEQSAPRE
jgi:hypothetical protein